MRLDDAGPRTWLLATAAGWALLGWALALAGMGGRIATLPDDDAQLRPLPPLRPAAAERLGPLGQYSELSARPLFSADRRPKPFTLQGKGDAEATQAAFDLQLTSVLITPNLRLAILQSPDGAKSVRVRQGEAPESHPGWRLVTLNPRSAVFEGPEGRKTLDLRVFNGQGGQTPTALSGGGAGMPAGTPAGTAPAPPMSGPAPAAQNPGVPPPRAIIDPPRPATGTTTHATGTKPGAPAQTPQMSEQAQMDAIRRRIQARREQLRQQQSQTQPPAQ